MCGTIFMPCRKSMIDLTVVGNRALSKEDMFKLAQKTGKWRVENRTAPASNVQGSGRKEEADDKGGKA